MKRLIPLVFAVLLLASCAARGYPTDDVYHPETDAQYYLVGTGGPMKVAQGEGCWYFSVGNMLLAVDTETMETFPLCSLPNCLHQEEKDLEKRKLCQAYLFYGSGFPPIFFQNGSLYTCLKAENAAEEYILLRVSPDGAERREVMRFPGGSFLEAVQLHRGVLYYVSQGFGEDAGLGTTLYAKSLDRPKEEPRALYSVQKRGISHGIVHSIVPYGNRLYVMEYVDQYRCALRIVDLRSGENTVMPFPDGTDTIGNVHPFGEKLLFRAAKSSEVPSQTLEGLTNYGLYRCEPDGSGAEWVGAFWGNSEADGEYYYQTDPWNGSMAELDIHILDSTLTEADVLPCSALGLEKLGSALIVPLMGDRVVLRARSGGLSHLLYFDRAEIGSGRIRPREFFRFDERAYG